VGLITEVKALALGAAIYLVASLLQPVQLLASAFSSAALLGGARGWWSWVSSAASLLASLLLAVGFHWARDRVIQSEAQREAAGTA
jgi:heme exporter protein D